MKAALLFLTVAAPAAGLLRVTENSVAIIHDAMQKLERLWPGGKGAQILTEITSPPRYPPRDHGHALGSRLRKKFESRDTFVFAAFGSSVSAGHDNVMNQSWPFELERILKPTFRAMGFDFEMRQRAMGGWGGMPFAAGCLHTRAGDRVDALSWEWMMFYDPPCEGHHFLAEAGAMPSHPVVFGFGNAAISFDDNLGFDEFGDWNMKKQDRRKPFFRNGDEMFKGGPAREWKPNEWYLTDDYISQEETARWQREAGVKVRPELVVPLSDEMTWLQRTGVAPEFERQGHAFYPISVSAATKYVIDDPWYQVREKAFNINWHPGPLGHTLIASAIAHFMLASLKTALTPEGPSLAHERTRGPGPTLDNPLVGKPIIGKLETPQCGSLRPRKCNSGVQPTTPGTGLRVDPSSPNTWQYMISMQVPVRDTKTIDQRLTYHGTKQDGEIRFNFRAKRNNQIVMLCGAPCGWRCEGNFGYVSTRTQIWWPENESPRKNVSDLAYTIDGQAVPSSNLLLLHDELFSENGKFCPQCRQVADICQPVAEVSQGDHTVGARVEARSRADPDASGNPMVVEILELIVVG